MGAVIEVVIGIVLLASPATLIQALIGPRTGDTTSVVARVLGGALLALGVVGGVARGTAHREVRDEGDAFQLWIRRHDEY